MSDEVTNLFYKLSLQERKLVECKLLKKNDVFELYTSDNRDERVGVYVAVADAYWDFSQQVWLVDSRKIM